MVFINFSGRQMNKEVDNHEATKYTPQVSRFNTMRALGSQDHNWRFDSIDAIFLKINRI